LDQDTVALLSFNECFFHLVNGLLVNHSSSLPKNSLAPLAAAAAAAAKV
jgi:hypothetical protein